MRPWVRFPTLLKKKILTLLIVYNTNYMVLWFVFEHPLQAHMLKAQLSACGTTGRWRKRLEVRTCGEKLGHWGVNPLEGDAGTLTLPLSASWLP
jgi:hypothetical protein